MDINSERGRNISVKERKRGSLRVTIKNEAHTEVHTKQLYYINFPFVVFTLRSCFMVMSIQNS